MDSDDANRLVIDLGRKLRAQNLSLVTAESCTGGKLAYTIISNPQFSGVLERGFIVYSIDAKCELLDLNRSLVEECDGVSAEIALSLAEAALRESHADVSAAITGFAGPREGDEEVGLVHIAVSSSTFIHHKELHLGEIGRGAVCLRATVETLKLLIESLPD